MNKLKLLLIITTVCNAYLHGMHSINIEDWGKNPFFRDKKPLPTTIKTGFGTYTIDHVNSENDITAAQDIFINLLGIFPDKPDESTAKKIIGRMFQEEFKEKNNRLQLKATINNRIVGYVSHTIAKNESFTLTQNSSPYLTTCGLESHVRLLGMYDKNAAPVNFEVLNALYNAPLVSVPQYFSTVTHCLPVKTREILANNSRAMGYWPIDQFINSEE
jgi:hypothetical protein